MSRMTVALPRSVSLASGARSPVSSALGGEVLLAGLLAGMLVAGVLGGVVVLATRRAGARFAVGPVLLAVPLLGLLGAPLVAAALGTA